MITTTKAIEKRRRENAALSKVQRDVAKYATPLKMPKRSAEDEKLINELMAIKFNLEVTNGRQAEYIKSLEAQKADLAEKNWKLQVLYDAVYEVKSELKKAFQNITSGAQFG